MDKILARPQTHCPPEHFLLTCRVPQVQHWAQTERPRLWRRLACLPGSRCALGTVCIPSVSVCSESASSNLTEQLFIATFCRVLLWQHICSVQCLCLTTYQEPKLARSLYCGCKCTQLHQKTHPGAHTCAA